MLQRPASLGERFGTYLFPQAAPDRRAPGPLCAVQIPTDLRDRPPRAADQRDRLGLELLAEPSARSVLWLYVDTFPEGAPLIIGVRRSGSRPRLVGRLRQRQPVWLVGRLLDPAEDLPRYLGLPGPKPLLGWDQASRDRRGVCVVEGPLDVRLVPSKLMLHGHQGMRG
jgi:hypothetical protein